MNDTANRKPIGRPPMVTPIREEAAKLVPTPTRVVPHVCPRCGKAQDPEVLKTYPDKPLFDVRCRSCGGTYQFRPATTRIIG
ncbi:MAG: hypothetical protein KGN77_05255 [Xanthomonadaceae bacterium]|nr:hypothetical protein [Xanthomonadaceae bacterium]